MIHFLKNHFRYYTMNTWNRSTSYANNVKLYNLKIPDKHMDMAYELVSGELSYDGDYTERLNEIQNDFLNQTGYAIGFNGRSSGYLVMYDTSCDTKTTQYHIMPGKDIDQYEDFEDWSMKDLQSRVKLIQQFDETCDKIRELLLDVLSNYKIVSQTTSIRMNIRKCVPKLKSK